MRNLSLQILSIGKSLGTEGREVNAGWLQYQSSLDPEQSGYRRLLQVPYAHSSDKFRFAAELFSEFSLVFQNLIYGTFFIYQFHRRFPVVEKRWRALCEKENQNTGTEDGVKQLVVPYLPTDSEFAAAFIDRKKRCAYLFLFSNFWLDNLLPNLNLGS